MASLSLSCLTTTTTTTKPRSSSRPVFAKPSHFITHANRSHRLQPVTCSRNQNDETRNSQSQGKVVVDRRNMLLGLGGGLYGAANLVSAPDASANPVQAPELTKCGNSNYKTSDGKEQEVYCCPPVSTGQIIDYKLPPVYQIKMRPSAHRVTPEYMFKYNTAIDRMRRLPKDDPRSFAQQANVHCAYCNGGYNQGGVSTVLQIHASWLFFPFHRWYLYFYERILGKLIGDPTFALPFWNWDNPKGMTMPPMFDDQKSALYDKNRNPDNRPPAVVDLGLTRSTDTLQVVANNLTIMYNEMIRGNSTVYDFMGKPYREGFAEKDAGEGSSERGSHTSVHGWVGDYKNNPAGEDMGNFYSAGRDPLFYCHHANVDRMWTLWQYFLPSNKVPDKRITDPDFLNASFLFYDENAQLVRVTVKDSLDNLRMGYEFERIDLPWLDYRPPRQAARAKINKTRSTTPNSKTLFPLTLDGVVRFQVDKTKKGKASEVLVLENITVDTTKLIKFDVFVNDEDDSPQELDKAAYLGTYAQVPRKSESGTKTSSIELKLTDLYNDMGDDIDDDETIVVTLVPRHQGGGVTIGGIKIKEEEVKPAGA